MWEDVSTKSSSQLAAKRPDGKHLGFMASDPLTGRETLTTDAGDASDASDASDVAWEAAWNKPVLSKLEQLGVAPYTQPR